MCTLKLVVFVGLVKCEFLVRLEQSKLSEMCSVFSFMKVQYHIDKVCYRITLVSASIPPIQFHNMRSSLCVDIQHDMSVPEP